MLQSAGTDDEQQQMPMPDAALVLHAKQQPCRRGSVLNSTVLWVSLLEPRRIHCALRRA